MRPRLGFGAFQVLCTHLQLLQPGEATPFFVTSRWKLDQWLGQNLAKNTGINGFQSFNGFEWVLMEIHGDTVLAKLSL